MWGLVSVKEAKQCFLDYVAHPDFDPTYVMLTDARGVDEIDASYRDILLNVMGLIKPLRHFKDKALSVILVENDMAYGMAHMLQQVLDSVSPIRVQTVEDEVSALALIDRPEKDFTTFLAALGYSLDMSFSDTALAQN